MALRKKAMDKNPDEFHFKMINNHLKVCCVLIHPQRLVFCHNCNVVKGPSVHYCSFFLGWGSCNKIKGGRNDRGAEEGDEDTGHQIC